ncbi:hypothetical protein AVEN_134770-1 [Araneus ventricosus]|uniref:Uncharacterized protein n=1 Tax=Araneus ventricosus TaxID=182803 RepID=A0A4Y2GBP0_ARAVE|nr:hypothetical protein AVEN_134770-1 [Araneus ventricosus]
MLSSSRLMSDRFSQASPREQVHGEEHIRSAFRQPQAFLQFQDIIFKRDSGAASLSILRGEVPFPTQEDFSHVLTTSVSEGKILRHESVLHLRSGVNVIEWTLL